MPSVEARALAAFDAYAELDPRRRAKALAELSAADPELHAELVRLLEADALRGPLLRSPQEILSGYEEPAAKARGDAPADGRIGSVLGPWRIEAAIGSGGMGTVYRASRADGQYSQVVALKCVGTEVDSPALAEAIRNERRTLALLEHPNIATLLDGGIDRDGYPWFAMQLVQGEPIDHWCDHRSLGLRERIELFMRLCDGLAYAHGKAALHSDIKPSNILVDEAGRPVLLDFGLSSLATQGRAARRRQVAMTFDYTAPEVPADGYSVRADIYALGAVLYQLLCGTWPMRGLPRATDAPSPPSPSRLALQGTADAARLRGLATPRALGRALSGDLDRIAARCVATDPEQRYSSVAQLRDDLSYWLQRRPISARRNDSSYRLRLFLRRNWLTTTLMACGLVGLGIGIGLLYGARMQAERHAEVARSMRRLFEDSFEMLTTGSLGQTPLMSRDMLHGAETQLRRSEAARAPEAGAYGLMLTALARSYTTLGDYRHAAELVAEARGLAGGRADQMAPIDAAFARLLNEQSHYPEAYRTAEAGLARIDEVPPPDRDMARLMLQVELARAQWGMARIHDAGATLAQAMAGAEAMAARDPTPLAELLIQRGQWRELFMRYEDAMHDFERARALAATRSPVVADGARAQLVAMLNVLEQHDRAVQTATALLESRRRLLGEDHPETGKAWVVLADSQFWSGQVDAALQSARRGEAILRAALGPGHPEVAEATMVIDGVYSQTGKSDEAVAGARRALAIMQQAHGPDHQRTLDAIGHLAATLAVKASETPEAKAPWQEVVSLFERQVRTGRRQGLPMLSARMFLVKAKLRIGQVDEGAEQELRQLIAALGKARGESSDAVRGARYTLLELYMQQDKLAPAQAMLEAMLREFDQAPDSLSAQGDRFNCHEALGDIAQAQGRLDAAREHWQQAHAIGMRMAPDQVSTARVAGKLAALASKRAAGKVVRANE